MKKTIYSKGRKLSEAVPSFSEDMSNVCQHFWCCHGNHSITCRSDQKSTFWDNCRNIWICMNNFRCFLASFEIQDDDEKTSFYVLLRHYQQKWHHLLEQAKGHLNNVYLFCSQWVPSTPPPHPTTVGVWVSFIRLISELLWLLYGALMFA